MRLATLTLTLAVMLGPCLGRSARADLTLDVASAAGANIDFTGSGSGATFVFNNNHLGQGFQVTESSNGAGSGTAVGLFGTLGGTYSYTSITTIGSVQTASVTTTDGSLTITDASHVSLTGNVAGLTVETFGTLGTVDVSGTINLTNVSYSGTNADLTQLKNEAAAGGGVLTISFQFLPTKSLTQLAGHGAENTTSYSASIATTAAVPEPSSLAIGALGALGLICYGLGRSKSRRVS